MDTSFIPPAMPYIRLFLKYSFAAFYNMTDFTGRASRAQFWHFWLFIMVVKGLILATEKATGPLGQLSTVADILLLIPCTSLQIRRLHDIGRNSIGAYIPALALAVTVLLPNSAMAPYDSWEYLVGTYAALANLAVFIFFFFVGTQQSEPGPNEHGPQPTY